MLKQETKNGSDIQTPYTSKSINLDEHVDTQIKNFTNQYLTQCQDQQSVQDLLGVGECAIELVKDYDEKNNGYLNMDKSCKNISVE